MPHLHTQRNPRFDRHITEMFQLKAQEAKAFLHPGISVVWQAQPIGVTRIPSSALKFGGRKDGFTFDVAKVRHQVPTFYNTVWDVVSNTTKNTLINIARGEIVQVDVDIGVQVTPTGPITAQLLIDTPLAGTNICLTHTFNPISADTRHFKTPFMWSEEVMDVAFKVLTINGVGQKVVFNAITSIYPSREISTARPPV